MQYLISTSNLCKYYSDTKALHNLTIHIPKGAIYGLIGANGAGKTTFLRLLCHLSKSTSGDILTDSTVSRSAMIESPALYPLWSASRNLHYQMMLSGNTTKSISELLDMVHLKDAKKPVFHFSLGMKQRLGIAMALVNQPDLLILDEPFNGLDPEGMNDMNQILTSIRDKFGTTILISSHLLPELQKIATHYALIQHGELVREFDASELEHTNLENLYFLLGGNNHDSFI